MNREQRDRLWEAIKLYGCCCGTATVAQIDRSKRMLELLLDTIYEQGVDVSCKDGLPLESIECKNIPEKPEPPEARYIRESDTEPQWKKFNLNNYMRFKVTEKGMKKYHEHCADRGISERDLKVDEDGNVHMQMWEVMSIWGRYMSMGSDFVIEPTFLIKTSDLG